MKRTEKTYCHACHQKKFNFEFELENIRGGKLINYPVCISCVNEGKTLDNLYTKTGKLLTPAKFRKSIIF